MGSKWNDLKFKISIWLFNHSMGVGCVNLTIRMSMIQKLLCQISCKCFIVNSIRLNIKTGVNMDVLVINLANCNTERTSFSCHQPFHGLRLFILHYKTKQINLHIHESLSQSSTNQIQHVETTAKTSKFARWQMASKAFFYSKKHFKIIFLSNWFHVRQT